MQRLFSMFPVGIAGFALFLLRSSVAVNLIVDATAHGSLFKQPWLFLVVAVPASLLALGLITPFSAAFTGILQFAAIFSFAGQNKFHLALSVLNSAVLAMLGPGAYSIDARIFGRRLLVVPPRRS